MSATYTRAHGNAGSLTHWARPGIEPTTSQFLVRFISAAPPRELPLTAFFMCWNVKNLKLSFRVPTAAQWLRIWHCCCRGGINCIFTLDSIPGLANWENPYAASVERKEGRKRGRKEGRKEGRKGGRKEGRKKGRKEGRTEEKRNMCFINSWDQDQVPGFSWEIVSLSPLLSQRLWVWVPSEVWLYLGPNLCM